MEASLQKGIFEQMQLVVSSATGLFLKSLHYAEIFKLG